MNPSDANCTHLQFPQCLLLTYLDMLKKQFLYHIDGPKNLLSTSRNEILNI